MGDTQKSLLRQVNKVFEVMNFLEGKIIVHVSW